MVEVDTVTGFFFVGRGTSPPCPATERGDKDGVPAVDLAGDFAFSDFAGGAGLASGWESGFAVG